MITEKRLSKFKSVVAKRQSMSVVLENVHDKHNIGAVMRTCDSVGIQELFVVYTDERLNKDKFLIGKNSASSARKWLDVHFYEDLDQCMSIVKKKYNNIYATHLGEQASTIYQTDFSSDFAVMFGNEKDGLSEAALGYADRNIYIPQVGLIQSLNISVACAVTMYEALRQRLEIGNYNKEYSSELESNQILLEAFLKKNENKDYEY